MNIYALSGILYGMDISALTTTNDIEKLRAMALAMVQKAMSENAEKERELQAKSQRIQLLGNDSNLLIVFYVQIMPDDFVMQLHRF